MLKIWDRNAKYRFGIGVFLVYQNFGYRLAILYRTLRYANEARFNILECSILHWVINVCSEKCVENLYFQ